MQGRDCQYTNSCNPANSGRFLMKDYPKSYSGDGMPPSGINPYQDNYQPGRNNAYYSRIRDAVAPHSVTQQTNPGSISHSKHNTSSATKRGYNSRATYSPVPSYHGNLETPAKELAHKYEDGRFSIYTIPKQNPQKYIKLFNNSTTKFRDKGYIEGSPRQVGWSIPDREAIMHYYYDPTTLGPMRDVLPYYQRLYHQKYATPEENLALLEAYKQGVRDHNNDIPHNHVEWKGRLFDCAKQPRTNRLCSDPIYSNPVMAKCAAQGKYMGRTNTPNICSLNGDGAPNFYDDEGTAMVPSGVSYINGNEVYHDFEDVDKAGLLTNNPVMKKNCNPQYQTPVENNSVNFWKTHSWQTYPEQKRNF